MSDETETKGCKLRAYALGKKTQTIILYVGEGAERLSVGLSLHDLDLPDDAVEILAHRLDRLLGALDAFLKIDDALAKGPPPRASFDITHG